jgi:sec-independent protein translocase protein TatB
MFDIGWSELLIIGVVALLVLGPEELPKAMRKAGQWAAKARNMARHFQSGIDEMVRQSELDDLRKQLRETQTAIKKDITGLQADVRSSLDVSKPAPPSGPPPPAPAMPGTPELLDGFGPKAAP